jgi:acyl-CoA dehydrogenase
MGWDFETETEFAKELEWMASFVREEVDPLEHVLDSPYDVRNPRFARLVRPLQREVKARKLWACHLGPELGGPGFGQVKLALMNEILGGSVFGPVVFGAQAPDTGNAEILAHFGTDEQKVRYLHPLLANDAVSCFSMTEPQGGADPLMFTTTAIREAAHWTVNGEKWFSSNARWADFLIVMAITDPDAPPYERMSMFIVPRDAKGLEIVRNVGYATEPVPSHAYLRFNGVQVPPENLLGTRGQAFHIAQTRLGGGRVHHAMRTVGEARRALDMMCERVLSRVTQGGRLSEKQMVQDQIADSWMELEQFRLLVLRTAWRIDRLRDYRKVRRDISAVKALMPKLLHQIASRALHLHGAYGLSDETPFMRMIASSFMLGLADGPTEVHKIQVARQTLREYSPASSLFPDYHRPSQAVRAADKFRSLLDELAGADVTT